MGGDREGKNGERCEVLLMLPHCRAKVFSGLFLLLISKETGQESDALGEYISTFGDARVSGASRNFHPSTHWFSSRAFLSHADIFRHRISLLYEVSFYY